jgi:nucleotide-binding universal stress UspA family protein
LFGKILVAVDGSEPSNDALDYAIDIAEKYGSAEVQLVHVIQNISSIVYTGGAGLEPIWIGSLSDDLEKSGKLILEDAKKKIKEKKAKIKKVSTKLLHGNPADEIVKLAKDGKFDLIVIGSRGLSGVKELILGSVSSKVVNHATVPVLVVK